MTSIGAVAAELGLSVETLRYYERAGLSGPARDGGGRRVYSEFDVDQLRLVVALRAVGIPIEPIRQLLAAKVRGAPSRVTAGRALQQLGAIDAALSDRQAQIEAAQSMIRGWIGEVGNWLGSAAGSDGAAPGSVGPAQRH